MTTASTLIQAVRDNASLDDTQKPTDSNILRWLNVEGAEVHGTISNTHELHLYKEATLSCTSSNYPSATLPSDFHRLKLVEEMQGTTPTALEPFSFLDWSNREAGNTCTAPAYMVLGDQIVFSPASAAIGTYRLRYVQAWTDLATGSSVLPSVYDSQRWSEMIVHGATARALSSMGEGEEARLFASYKEEQKQRIIEEAANRDATGRERVRTRGYDPYACPLDSFTRK